MLNKILNSFFFISLGWAEVNSFSQSIKPMQKQRLVFFPARFQQPLPSELYGNFISVLNNNYELHVASRNKQDNDELLQRLHDSGTEYDNIAFISHSSGAADLWDVYYSNPDINVEKVVLIEPLDLKKGGFSIPSPNELIPFNIFDMDMTMDFTQVGELNDKIEQMVETDYVELFKSNMFGGLFSDKKTKPNNEGDDYCALEEPNSIKGKLLVVKHAKSDKWRFIPTIPPLSRLNSDLTQFEKTMDVSEVMVDNFSHFDILDRPWANLMNRASLGDNKQQEELNEYLETLGDIVTNFYDTI
tara:strand:+ start:642 stop:1544 length:903 start_codon:yes stop_codon:yes gene_type:complete